MRKSRFFILLPVIALLVNVFSVSNVFGVKYGDVNDDGTIDSLDLTMLKRYILRKLTIDNLTVADLNGDNSADSLDVTILKRYLLRKLSSFPVEDIPKDERDEKVIKLENELKGDIIFSVPSGTFKNQVTVELSSKIPDAQIRYTVDGSVPAVSSKLYTGPLTFTTTTQLRAQSFVNGSASGDMGTAIYVASSIDAEHGIPVLILDAYGKGKPDREYKDVAFILLEPRNNKVSLLQPATIVTRAGFHVRGQSSANFEKTPYRLELRDNKDDDAKYPMLGMPGDGDWALISPYPDKSLIRNALAYELGKEMGLATPRYAHVEVYINFDNQPLSADDYQGVYLLTETLEIGKDRLNIKKLKEDDLTEPNITGGYLMQFNMMAAEEPLIRGNGWNDLELKEPDDLLPEQLAWITNYIQKVHDSIHSQNPSDPQTGYPAYIDVDSFVDFIIHTELGKQPDSYIRSAHIHKDRGQKLKAGPLWDYDLAYDSYTGLFGLPSSNIEGWQYQSTAPMMPGMATTTDWYYTLMQDPNFRSKVKARWEELRKGPLSDEQLVAKVRELSKPLSNAAHRNFQKWNILSTPFVGGFSTQVTQTWEEQIQIVENYLLKRAAWIDSSGWEPTSNPGWPGWPGWGGGWGGGWGQ